MNTFHNPRIDRLSWVMGEIRNLVMEGRTLDRTDPIWKTLLKVTNCFGRNTAEQSSNPPPACKA